MGFPRAGSNPVVVEYFFHAIISINHESAVLRRNDLNVIKVLGR